MFDDKILDGQLTITDYLKSKIELRQVDDFTSFLNNQGKSQYQQIGDIIKQTYEQCKDNDDFLDCMTNKVSIYVLNQSLEYSKYLRDKSRGD